MKKIGVGFLGLGNIGSGVYRILTENKMDIAHRDHVEFEIKRALVRDVSKARRVSVDASILTDVPNDVLHDKDIQIVVEFMGGVEPARTYLLEALSLGKTVVTANKEVIAKCWPELERAAKKSGAGLYFEASVAGGIPIIRTMWDSMQGNNIDCVMGIINGTTNYILTKMTEEGKNYADVLREAQELGLAEPDPTSDVEGMDAVYKLSILSSMAFHGRIPIETIYREGITRITAKDIAFGNKMGLTLKLLAIGKKEENRVQVRVHPTFVPNHHPIAAVRGAFNAVFLHGSAVGDLMLYGRGAGDMPTASAIVSDMVYASYQSEHRYVTFVNEESISEELMIENDWETEFFVSTVVQDKPGVLAKIAGVFGAFGVSLAQIDQTAHTKDEAPLIFLTHKTQEQDMKKAIAKIKQMPEVVRVENVIRVEGR